MYYEPYRRKEQHKRGRKKKRSCMGFLLGKLMKLIITLLILAIAATGILYILPVEMLNVEPANVDLSITKGLPADKLNVLLLGLDVLDGESQRSDTMIIATIDGKSVKLTSIMRDTLVEIPGHGTKKINSAYSYGGADMAMRCVNQTFGLNITNYIAMDFVTLVKLVDAVGGIEMEISDAERVQMNNNVGMSAWMFRPLGYDAVPMTQSGKVHLNGLFALGYARIRKIDSDYMRTHRQRKVISAIKDEVKDQLLNPLLYVRLFGVLQSSVDTNLNIAELVSLASKAVLSGEIQTMRIPENQHCEDNGSSIRIVHPNDCRASLRAFLYS